MKKLLFLFILPLLLFPSVLSATINDNMVSYWKFDTDSSTALKDVKGLNNYTMSGTVAYNSSGGLIGGAFNIVGEGGSTATNRLSIIGVNGASANSNLTLSFWINPSSTTLSDATNEFLFSFLYHNGAAYDSVFYIVNSPTASKINTATADSSPTWSYVQQYTDYTPPANKYTHIALTLEFTNTTTATYRTYINGTLRNETNMTNFSSGPINEICLNGDVICRSGWTAPHYIDEMVLYNRSLTTTEVNELYTRQLSGEQYPFITTSNTTAFISQTPADLTIQNIINENVNVTYNITLPNLNYSSVFLNYTVVGGQVFVNSSRYDTEYNKQNYTINTTNQTFVFSFDGDRLLSGTYNFFIEDTEDYTHNLLTLGNNDIIKTKIINVRNNTSFNFIEAYLNTTGNSNVYYCNETYTTGNPAVNNNCFLLTTFTGIGFNHTHNNSRHNVIPFPINSTSGKLGTVQVTNTSYILIKGNTNNAYIGYISQITRSDQVQLSGNIGGSYANVLGTTDMHIHQFSSDALTYAVFASNGTQINSSWRSDTLGTFNIAPTNVVFTNPINESQTFTRYLNITYTGAISTGGTISNYNITLLNSDQSFNRTLNITPNNLYYYWDSYDTNTDIGIYYIKIIATDSNGLISTSISETINHTRNGYINITVKKINVNTTINSFSINITNTTAGINNEVYTTTNGVILADIIKGYTYNVFVDATGYAYNSTTKTTPAIYNNLTMYLYTTNSFNIAFYDEVTRTLLNTRNISFDIFSDIYSNNLTTANGTLYIDLLSPSSYTFRYRSLTDYPERTYIVALTDREHIDLNLYLVNTTTVITINVKDQDDNILSDAYIKVLRYDLTTNTYTVREIVKTNVEGNAYFSGILNTEFYKFIVEYPFGNEVETTSPDYLRSTSLTLRVNLEDDPLTDYFQSINVYSTLAFTEATNNFNFYYNDAENTATQGCLYVYRTINYVNTLINSSCSASSSGTILLSVDNQTGYTYTAQGTVTIGTTEYLLKTLSHTFDTITVIKTKNNYFFLTLLLTMILSLLFVWNITVALIITPLPIFLMSLTGMIPISRSVGITMFLIGLTLAVVISKKA